MHAEVENTRLTVPAGLARRRVSGGPGGITGGGAGRGGSAGGAPFGTTVARPGTFAGPSPMARAASAAAAKFGGPPADTLLPGALPRPDNLLPRPAQARASASASPSVPSRTTARRTGRRPVGGRGRLVAFVRTHWRHVVVLAIIGVALTLSVSAVLPVLHSGASSTPAAKAQEARATNLLRTVAGGGRTLYAAHHSFADLSRTALSADSYNVKIVAPNAIARTDEVSVGVGSGATLMLATPADAKRCVFARDEPASSTTLFVTVSTTECRAASAPARGWKAR